VGAGRITKRELKQMQDARGSGVWIRADREVVAFVWVSDGIPKEEERRGVSGGRSGLEWSKVGCVMDLLGEVRWSRKATMPFLAEWSNKRRKNRQFWH
jgi:hypothetical protein